MIGKRRVALLAALALLCCTATASADRGVALDLGKLEIAQTLMPGGGYTLPPIGVRNPGDVPTTYRLLVTHISEQSAKVVPEDWLQFSPREITLKPGETKKVSARLSLPTGADPGRYEALLAAQIVTKGQGAQVGAAAAAKLDFKVKSATWLGAQWYRLRTFLSGHTPWTWLVPAILLAGLGGRQARRRFSFQVSRRA
jgi:hypothetical protein